MPLVERLRRWADAAAIKYPTIMADETALMREAADALEAAERRARFAREELDARTAFVEAQAEAPSIDMGDGYPWAVHALTERQAYSKSEIAVLLAEQYNRATQAEAEAAALREALERIEGQAVCYGMDGDEGNARMLMAYAEIARAALSRTKEDTTNG